MKISAYLLFIVTALLVSCKPAAAQNSQPRLRLNADTNWHFSVGDPANAKDANFDDSAWRTLTLPHDWSIEGEFDPKAPMGGAGGFFPAGIGWYRRVIDMPLDWQGKRITMEFEGVYMNAEVYLNGQKIANQPYGYITFFADLTPALKAGKNVLAVRVDNSQQKNSRWYSGSGIYRHVWLHVTNPLHVSPWGIFVTTPKADAQSATVNIQTELTNNESQAQTVTVQTLLISPSGKELAKLETQDNIPANGSKQINQQTVLNQPALWSPANPQLSRIITRVIQNGSLLDETTTTYGIRTLAWSVEKGLTLNGETIKLYGGCIHHDNGCLGAAAFDRAEERKVQQLLAAGFNAVRTAHNPPSPAFLDICDRLGMLVMDEAFDCWTQGKNEKDYNILFKDWWERDLTAMVKRDRNHPSVVMWSIGNEIIERYEPFGAEIGKKLADHIRTLDISRPVTEGILFRPKPEEMPIFDQHAAALDITGYNYNINSHGEDHARVPDRIMVSTESLRRDTFNIAMMMEDFSYIVGDFSWTALDYLGEAGIGRVVLDGNADDHGRDEFFPWHGAECGDIDIIGTRRTNSYYTNIIWNRGETLYLAVRQPVAEGHKFNLGNWSLYPEYASWTWPGFEEQKIQAVIYARADVVKLYQDNKLIGEKPAQREQKFRAQFDLTYRPGTLRAEAWKDGKKIAEQILTTTQEASAVTLIADRKEITANHQDLSFITVEIVDKNGQWQQNTAQEIQFKIEGPGIIAGVANADMSSTEPYHGTKRKTYRGRALIVIRSTEQAGTIKLTATAEGLTPASLTVQSRSIKQENILP